MLLLTFPAGVVGVQSIPRVALGAQHEGGVEVLAVRVSQLAVSLGIEVVSERALGTPSVLNLVAIGNGLLGLADHAPALLDLKPDKARGTSPIGGVESFTRRVGSCASPTLSGIEAHRTLLTGAVLESVAVGVEVTCHYSRQTGVLDNSEARVAGQTGSIARVICVTVGVHWLTDGFVVQPIPSDALHTDTIFRTAAPPVANYYSLRVSEDENHGQDGQGSEHFLAANSHFTAGIA